METGTKPAQPAWWYWVLAALALVWNGLGAFAWIMVMAKKDTVLAQMPAAEQALISAAPTWYWLANGLAVIAAVLGCLSLLARRKWAVPLFALSFLAVLVMHVYTFFLSDAVKVMGMRAITMPVYVIFIALMLFLFALQSRGRGWIS